MAGPNESAFDFSAFEEAFHEHVDTESSAQNLKEVYEQERLQAAVKVNEVLLQHGMDIDRLTETAESWLNGDADVV